MPKRPFSELEDKNKVNAWSEKNKLKAHEVSLFSHKTAIFKCYNEDCGHEFESMIFHISSGSWCPFCSRTHKLCGEKSCITCHKNSFASFHDKDKVNALSENNGFKAHEVTIYSHEEVMFKCYNEECGREFELEIYRVSKDKNWCPCCTGYTFCKKKKCIPCYNKSFASFKDKDKVNALSEKNGFKAHEVSLFSNEDAIFKCYKCGREFKTKIYDISKHGHWCKFCYVSKNRFIKKLFEIFDDMNMEYNVETTVKCEGRNLRWDMIVYKNEIDFFYIESDGEQHFSVEGLIFSTKISREEAQDEFKKQRESDLLKEKHIVDNNKLLFRISYRQFNQLENLVKDMISKSDEGHKGVVKMDDIYDW